MILLNSSLVNGGYINEKKNDRHKEDDFKCNIARYWFYFAPGIAGLGCRYHTRYDPSDVVLYNGN